MIHDREYGPPTMDEFIEMAKNRICQRDEPWVNRETWPYGDHGHTDCYFIGGLLSLVLAQKAWMEAAYDELGDLRSQYGDDYLFMKHNERFYTELRDAYLLIYNSTF